MMRNFIVVILILNCISGHVLAQNIPVPELYTIIDTATGDLDGDGIPELVVAYNMKMQKAEDSDGVPRELIIYKSQNKLWSAWKKSKYALLGSKDGGMMGDPFGEMKIVKNVLNISHNGGSSWKWNFTDKYRLQGDEFILIGYTSTYFRLCDYWERVDFNLVTGNAAYSKEFEKCYNGGQQTGKTEKEKFVKKGIKITMNNRFAKDIRIITPRYKRKIYLSFIIQFESLKK